jgi:DNA-binding transcriptional MerR regulator
MARPSVREGARGLTSGEVAKQLGYSRSNVDRLRKCGLLPGHRDRSGVWRYTPPAVAAAAEKLGRKPESDGRTASRIYAYFLKPGFRGTPEELARVVHETEQSPRVVRELWAEFKMGSGAPNEEQVEARELDRLAREYDEQIEAMDDALKRKRRGVFIAQEPDGPRSRAKK